MWRPGTREVRAYDCYLPRPEVLRAVWDARRRAGDPALHRAVELEPGLSAGVRGPRRLLVVSVTCTRDRSETSRGNADRASLQAVTLDPDSAQAQASRGQALSISRIQQEAERAFETARPARARLSSALLLRAATRRLGQAQEASSLYEEACGCARRLPGAPASWPRSTTTPARTAEAAAVRRLGVERAERRLETDPDD